MGRGFDISWIGVSIYSRGRGFDIAWIGDSIYQW